MLMLIGGCPRSGTSILKDVCSAHPEIHITTEFSNLLGLGKSLPAHAASLLLKAWRKRACQSKESRFGTPWQNRTSNVRFALEYLTQLALRGQLTRIDLAGIEATLKAFFPHARIVGDKYPLYAHYLGRFTGESNLKLVIIHRDCRDVVSSLMQRARSDWKGRAFARPLEEASSAAARWVDAMQQLAQHREQLLEIRYDRLVTDSAVELTRLADYLGVDPAGFPAQRLSQSSIGKHKKYLSPEELKAIHEVADSTMQQWSYAA